MRLAFAVLTLLAAYPAAAQAAGDDFFAYANRDWLEATAIPAGKERWGARDGPSVTCRLGRRDLSNVFASISANARMRCAGKYVA